MTDWSKIGKASRSKGARFEREVVRQINDALGRFGVLVGRTQRGDKQTEGDIVVINGSPEDWPYDAELKYRGGPPIALADILGKKWWGWSLICEPHRILIIKTARKPAIVFLHDALMKRRYMLWEEFLERTTRRCAESCQSSNNEDSSLLP